MNRMPVTYSVDAGKELIRDSSGDVTHIQVGATLTTTLEATADVKPGFTASVTTQYKLESADTSDTVTRTAKTTVAAVDALWKAGASGAIETQNVDETHATTAIVAVGDKFVFVGNAKPAAQTAFTSKVITVTPFDGTNA